MINREVCEYVKKVSDHFNENNEEYFCDRFVKEGYGQTAGGYLKNKRKVNSKKAEPSQQEHFLHWYSKEEKINKAPSYSSLWCPQLMMFIAEIAGVPIEKIKAAGDIVKKYEDKNKLRNRDDKEATYMRGLPEFSEFKSQLRIVELNKIIKSANNWNEVKEKARNL